VTYLRTIEDSERLRDAIQPGRRITILGGGFLGLEVAATARAAGATVTLIEQQDVPLQGILGREVGQVFAGLHRDRGVDLRLGVKVVAIERLDDLAVVQLADHSRVEAELLVVGIGASPNVELARAAGLAVDDGVVVDDRMRTAAPDVYAAGDVANAWHPVLERRLRVEHWDNAQTQGAVAGRNLAGDDVSHTSLPYFFTDQYDLGMEYVGHVGSEGYDEVVLRGDVPQRVFSAFWMRGGTVVAAMHANDWDTTAALRDLVGCSAVDVAALRDPAVPLTDIARGAARQSSGGQA
jgi:NADPH-dependent 2,4-dienoyl-CoA reductase/sulfur reductase-like enzyme